MMCPNCKSLNVVKENHLPGDYMCGACEFSGPSSSFEEDYELKERLKMTKIDRGVLPGPEDPEEMEEVEEEEEDEDDEEWDDSEEAEEN